MITNKKSIRFFMAVFFMAVMNFVAINTASAQSGMGQKLKDMTPEQRAAFQTNMMKTKLGLDTQQIFKVKTLNLEYALKFQPIIKSDEGRLSKFKQAKALQEQKDDKLKGIFTTAQFKQYKDFEDEMRSKMAAMVKQ